MITLEEYLMSRDVKYPPTPEMYSNANIIIIRANALMHIAGIFRKVVSGYRPAAINAITPGAAKNSLHMTCEAVDLYDKDKKLADFCLSNLHILEGCSLWMEDPKHTQTWVHVQSRPPASGKLVFIP